MEDIFFLLPPSRRRIPPVAIICARKGCKRKFKMGERGQERRRIGNLEVCRPCYQTAWRISKKKNISLEKAFNRLPEKK